jgi:hypothetical protein
LRVCGSSEMRAILPSPTPLPHTKQQLARRRVGSDAICVPGRRGQDRELRSLEDCCA